MGHDLRQYRRFACDAPVAFEQADGTDQGGLVKDLSLGGVKVCLNQFVPLNSIVSMKLRLTNPDRVVPVRGRVVWVKELSASERFEVGLQFIAESQADSLIRGYLRSRRYEIE